MTIKRKLRILFPGLYKIYKNICSMFKKPRKIASPEALAAESVWAHVFNNTISNSIWLKDKSFSPGRWAVGYPYLYVMYRVLNEIHPKRILELGLGQSTKMIAQFAKEFDDVEHVVVEHDKDWCNFFSKSFNLSERTTLQTLDLQMTDYKKSTLWTYKDFNKRFTGQSFDFISIDAPFGTVNSSKPTVYSRIDIIGLLPEILSPDFVIMIDDTERAGERNTIAEITSILKDNGVEYRVGTYHGAKDCTLICAAHLGFLTSM